MRRYFILLMIPALISCSYLKPAPEEASTSIEVPLLPPQKAPLVLQIKDYKNRESGAALAPWLRSYLENGISGVESMTAYKNSYIFVAVIHSPNQTVISQWIRNFYTDHDFSRLAAERIRRRLDRNVSNTPYEYYGPVYMEAVKAAYAALFWGARKEDDGWILEDRTAVYWGFILLSIPKESLQIQVNDLLDNLENRRAPRLARDIVRAQHAAFNEVREHFFDQF